MAKYRLSEEVPWRKVLSKLRWALELRIKNCKRYYKRYTDLKIDEEYRQNALDCCKDELEDALSIYTALRKFLGYSFKTKIEQEALEILDSSCDECKP